MSEVVDRMTGDAEKQTQAELLQHPPEPKLKVQRVGPWPDPAPTQFR